MIENIIAIAVFIIFVVWAWLMFSGADDEENEQNKKL